MVAYILYKNMCSYRIISFFYFQPVMIWYHHAKTRLHIVALSLILQFFIEIEKENDLFLICNACSVPRLQDVQFLYIILYTSFFPKLIVIFTLADHLIKQEHCKELFLYILIWLNFKFWKEIKAHWLLDKMLYKNGLILMYIIKN